MAELDWGRRFLMCPPTYFGVIYEINPWMNKEVVVDPDRAKDQWDNLTKTMRDAGAELEFLEGKQDWPDLVFTANAGIVNGNQFVPTHFRHIERQGETRYNIEWFTKNGFKIDRLPHTLVHEGAGDALPFGNGKNKVLLSGFRTRTEAASHGYLSRLTGAAIKSLELVDDRLYHIDLAFTPLSDTKAMIATMGFDRFGIKMLKELVPEALFLEDDEALSFCCNSVVVGTNIVMPNCPPRVGRQLEAWGFNVMIADVSEFMKGGGGCRCLTLALDVTVGVNQD